MAKIRVAINGFGRIGRSAFKAAWERSDIEVVAINDLNDAATLAHLLKHDSTYGEYSRDVIYADGSISIDGASVKVVSEGEPTKLPWRELEIDVVLECTGVFTETHRAQGHIQAGARKVVLSAPSRSDDVPNIIMGVNDDTLNKESAIISAGSCVANATAPIIAVLNEAFGIEAAMVSAVHSVSSSQRLLDAPAGDLRRSRSALVNIIPAYTEALAAISRALPDLAGKISSGVTYRVPLPVVSIVEVNAVLTKAVTVDEINAVFEKASREPFYQGILNAVRDQLVSSDFRGDSHSSIVDLPLTAVAGGTLVKVSAWFDNEWGFANRLVELAADAGRD